MIKSKFSRELNSKWEVGVEAYYGMTKIVGRQPKLSEWDLWNTQKAEST